jgi:hypothetical protein
MKKNVLFLLLLTSTVMFGQKKLKVGKNPTIINSSAAFEIESSDKGFLPPRMTSAQQAGISSPALGLQVYCIDCSPAGMYSYNGLTWAPIGSSSSATTTVIGAIQLAGDLSGTAEAPTVTNSAVIGKVLTGFTSASGAVSASDSVLGAIQKIDGNISLKAPLVTPIFTEGVTINSLDGNPQSIPTLEINGQNTLIPTTVRSIDISVDPLPEALRLRSGEAPYTNGSTSIGFYGQGTLALGRISAVDTSPFDGPYLGDLVFETGYDGKFKESFRVVGASNETIFNTKVFVPTAASGTSTKQVATTEFVTDALTTRTASTTSLGTIKLSGDLSGSAESPSVVKIQNVGVSAITPTYGQLLQYNGTNWIPANIRMETDVFTPTQGQSMFTVSYKPIGKVSFFINGVRISNAAITISGDEIIYNSASNGNNVIQINDRISIDYIY